MKYITHSLCAYSPKNKKWEDVILFSKQLNNLIIVDEYSFEVLKKSIRSKLDALNEMYPRSKPLSMEYKQNQLSVFHKTNGMPEYAFILSISKCAGIYDFSNENPEPPVNNFKRFKNA